MSKTDWKAIGEKTGWLKDASSLSISSNNKDYLKLAQNNDDWHPDTNKSTKDFYADLQGFHKTHPIDLRAAAMEGSHKIIGEARKASYNRPDPIKMSDAMDVMRKIQPLEQAFSDELASIAIDCVRHFLDFEGFDNIEWDVAIGESDPNPNAGSNLDSKTPEADKNDANPHAQTKMDNQVHRRLTTIYMQQGAAMRIYSQCGKWVDEHMSMFPEKLRKLYGQMGIYNHSSYFVDDWFAIVMRASGGSGAEVGSSSAETNSEGHPVAKARAECFPMLVYECTRAALEVLSFKYSEQKDQKGQPRFTDEQKKEVYKHTENHLNEVIGWQAGSELDRKIHEFIAEPEYEGMTYVWFFRWVHKQQDHRGLHELLNFILKNDFANAKIKFEQLSNRPFD